MASTKTIKADAAAADQAPVPADGSAVPAPPAIPQAAPQDAPAAPAATAKPEESAKPEAPITFSVYCQHKRIPERHMPGMEAFTTVRQATMAEWEKIFQTY